MFGCTLFQENGDAIASVTDAPTEFLQLGLQEFVIGTLNDVRDARLQCSQPARDRVWNEIGLAHTKLAAFTKIRFRIHCREKFVRVIDKLARQSHASCVAHHREKPLARARIVEPLDGRS